MSEQYTIAQYANDLRRITAETEDENEIFKQVGPLAQRLSAETNWIEERFFTPDPETGFSAFLLHEEDDHRPKILGDETCYCLIVQQGSLHFTGRFSRVLNLLGE